MKAIHERNEASYTTTQMYSTPYFVVQSFVCFVYLFMFIKVWPWCYDSFLSSDELKLIENGSSKNTAGFEQVVGIKLDCNWAEAYTELATAQIQNLVEQIWVNAM